MRSKILHKHYIKMSSIITPLVMLVFFSGLSCEKKSDVETVVAGAGTTSPTQNPPAQIAAPGQSGGLNQPADISSQKQELIASNITEDTFVETISKRDPFRSFLIPLTKHELSVTPQISSILDQYQIEELKLVAIISSYQSGSPIAMVEDPEGVGHIIRRGNYIGKGEIVRRVATGEEMQIFWKVARIREDAVVFEREDPFSSSEATVTKILSLQQEK